MTQGGLGEATGSSWGMAGQQHPGMGEVRKSVYGMDVQNSQDSKSRSQDKEGLRVRIKELENKLDEKEDKIKKLEASLYVSEAKFRGMEESVKVLGDVIVKMSHGNQPAGRSQTTNQPEINSGFGQTLARAQRSTGMVGERQQMAPDRAYKKQNNKEKTLNLRQDHPPLPEGWKVR